MRITCEDTECRSFSFLPALTRLSGSPVRVKVFRVSAFRGTPVAATTTPKTFAHAWADLVKGGVDTKAASAVVATEAGNEFLTLHLPAAGGLAGQTELATISTGSLARKDVRTEYVYREEDRPIFALAAENGTLAREGNRWRVDLSGSKAEIEVGE